MTQAIRSGHNHTSRRVAVIGAGMAGLSAALHLIKQGQQTTLYEAAPQAGGRTRGVSTPHTTLDNGQHLCLGAYQATLQLIEQAGLREQAVFLRLPLALQMHDGEQRMSLNAPRYLPAPLHLLWALCTAQGLSVQSKWRATNWMRQLKGKRFQLEQDVSVAALLQQGKQTDQTIRWLWEPLCLAALNTPIDLASAQIFLNVLRDSFQYRRRDSDFLIVKHDLSTALIQPLLHQFQLAGGELKQKVSVNKIEVHPQPPQASAANEQMVYVYTDHQRVAFDAVIIAVGPHQLKTIEWPHSPMPELFHYQPITTVYMQFASHLRLPYPVMGFCHGWAQWVFDRGQCCSQPGLLAMVISAHPSLPTDKDAWIHQCIVELNQCLKPYSIQLPSLPIWSKIITEKRATFSCDAGLKRPSFQTDFPQIFLAGDYVAGDYPATIEGAVRSGMQAANACLEISA